MALVAGGGAGPKISPEQKNRNAFRSTTVVKKSPEQKNRDAFRDLGRRAPNPYPDGNPKPKTPAKTPVKTAAKTDPNKVTSAQKAAAANLAKISAANAQSVKDEYARSLARYDQADAQTRQSAGLQRTQNSRQSASDRFLQNRKLQQAAQGLVGSAGNAMQGSGSGNLADMLRTRTDMDTTQTLDTLRGNQDQVYNAMLEAINANVYSRNEAASKAQTALSNMESDMAAQLNNINPTLFVKPGTKTANLGAAGFAKSRTKPIEKAKDTGYIMPGNMGRYLTR